jgi:hypothetical protein
MVLKVNLQIVKNLNKVTFLGANTGRDYQVRRVSDHIQEIEN